MAEKGISADLHRDRGPATAATEELWRSQRRCKQAIFGSCASQDLRLAKSCWDSGNKAEGRPTGQMAVSHCGILLWLLSLLLSRCGAASVKAVPFNVTVLHFNDWHNRMEANSGSDHVLCDTPASNPGSCSGGFARMKHVIDQQRLQDPDLLLLNAGDDFIGTVWDSKFTPSTGYDGAQPAFFMNMIKPVAMTIGNHDFDFGIDALDKYLGKLQYPALGACNVQANGHSLGKKLQQFISFTRQSVKFCIFGLVTQQVSMTKTSPATILDPYHSGQVCAQQMQQQGCKVIILLSHLGYTSDLYAAKIIPGIDLIVGGHSHSLLWNGQAPEYEVEGHKPLDDVIWGSYPTLVTSNSGKKVPVVTAGWGSRYMGIMKMTVDPQAGAVVHSEGWPLLLGCGSSASPVDEDSYAVAQIKKWRYW